MFLKRDFAKFISFYCSEKDGVLDI